MGSAGWYSALLERLTGCLFTQTKKPACASFREDWVALLASQEKQGPDAFWAGVSLPQGHWEWAREVAGGTL